MFVPLFGGGGIAEFCALQHNPICNCLADVKLLHEREDWKVHDEDGGLVTSLPVLFENRVVEVLLTLKEIVNEPQEYSQVQINQELRDTARDHFAALLEVGVDNIGLSYLERSRVKPCAQ